MFNTMKQLQHSKKEEKRLETKLCISWHVFYYYFLIWCQGNICNYISSLDTSQTTYSGKQQKNKIIVHIITYQNKNWFSIIKLLVLC